MRERRWETRSKLTFGEVLEVGERLAALGLKPRAPAKDVICYLEGGTVDSLEDFDRLDPWSTEDVTLVHVREGWQDDFFPPGRSIPLRLSAISGGRHGLFD